jgi:putative tricarboxylic transport membrane protein
MERGFQSIVAAAFLLLSVAYGIGSLLLPMGTLERPGPGFFPSIVALVMAALSGPLLWRFLCIKEPQPLGEHSFPRGPDLRRVLALGGSLILFAVLLQPLGYRITSALLMGTVLRLLGMRHWGRIALSAVLATAISYWIFALLLDVPLPPGDFF